MIGYVPQEVVLFNDTILNNILLGRQQLMKKGIIDQLYDYDILSFIKSFPSRLSTIVGIKD